MLSYRHIFHAGNFADVHKHAVLTLLIGALRRKDKGFCYLDTHAGAGRYDLYSAAARKNAEFSSGVTRVVQHADVPGALQDYIAALRACNGGALEPLRYYPGSPRLVRTMLREQDRMVLMELHNNEVQNLREEFAGDRQVGVHHVDGYEGLNAFLPPAERRGLVLIDPAYERRDEYQRAIHGLESGYRKWPSGMFALWYPIDERSRIDALHERLRATGIRKILVAELCIYPDDLAQRLNGSGMVIVNPPWQLDETLRELQPWLWDVLSVERLGFTLVEWLTTE